MIPAQLHPEEEARLNALEAYNIMDTAPEDAYNDIVALASQICNSPISLISLVDSYRQWFKAEIGLGVPQTPRDLAFCAHAILQDDIMEVHDTLEDERFFDNPLVTNAPDIRFYAGVPLTTPSGHNLGTLCVIDTVPKTLTEGQRFALKVLGQQIINQMELRLNYQKIQAQNNHILESIQYAEKIQKAFLPSDNNFKALFKDFFTLYQPKDVVSGDFYWLNEKDDRIILVLADCTGHGVPGAMMSMYGSSILNNIILDKDITMPEEILKEVLNTLVNSINEMGNATNDGMEMAVCVINKKKKILKYAGSYMSLYYVQDNNFVEIKADKIPISTQNRKGNNFTRHEISLEKPLKGYIFTDGFSDQFDATDKTRFMKLQFRNLISSIHTLSLNEQKNVLTQVMENWRGNVEQTDDISVIGFEVGG